MRLIHVVTIDPGTVPDLAECLRDYHDPNVGIDEVDRLRGRIEDLVLQYPLHLGRRFSRDDIEIAPNATGSSVTVALGGELGRGFRLVPNRAVENLHRHIECMEWRFGDLPESDFGRPLPSGVEDRLRVEVGLQGRDVNHGQLYQASLITRTDMKEPGGIQQAYADASAMLSWFYEVRILGEAK